MALEKEQFLRKLEGEVDRHPALNHPFLKRCQNETTIESARLFAINYYQYSKDFYRLMAGTISVIPDEQTREPLILNLFQGGGNDDIAKTHPALFRVFIKALGLSMDEVKKHGMIPEIAAYYDTAWAIIRDGHWLEALAAISVGVENPVPRFYTPIVTGLRKLKTFKDGDLIFFDAHIELDKEHYAKAREVLVPWATTEENQGLIRKGVMRILDARAIVWDGLERVLFKAKEPSRF